MSKRFKILNSYVDALTMNETINNITKYIQTKACVQHVVINASKIIMMQSDGKLREIVNCCPIINADGQSIVWGSRFLGNNVPERVTGIDLFDRLVELCADMGFKPYFFGAQQDVVEKTVEHYKMIYPNLNVAGYRNGFFSDCESKEIAVKIKNSGADILFVAFSSPKKEYWIKENMSMMEVPFAMGVGGSFDIVAGVTKRAPKWMQKFGLEWFYRFIQEPKRMWKRYIIGNYKFLILIIREKFSKKNTNYDKNLKSGIRRSHDERFNGRAK